MVINNNDFDTTYENYLLSTINDAFENNINKNIDTKVADLNIFGYITNEPVKFADRLNGEYKKFKIGETWGSLFQCAWFKLEGKIDNYNHNLDYYLKLDLAGEALLFDKNGKPVKGFTNGSSAFDRNLGEPGKIYYKINDFINKDGSVKLWVDAAANDLFGNLSLEGKIQITQIVTRDIKLLKLYYDYETLFSLLSVLDKKSNRYLVLLRGLYEASLLIIYQEDDYLNKAKEILAKLLNTKTTNQGKFYAVGHGHMDLAWLWPIRETRRKIGRTFANVVDNIKNHPKFIYGVSQPQQLVWLKEDYPQLYSEVKQYIKEGRIELQGGMWVESDTNIPNGESLTRQMLYGIKYYEKEFGYRVRNLWLPDVFGYNGNLPQIIKKSGLDYFMTIKISWNLVNRFPYHTFNWEGIDGTKVLTHMPPEGTYNSPSLASKNYLAWNNYREKDIAPEALIVYGIGNGGAGPGYEHLARIDRQANLDPIPQIEYSRAADFFEKLKKYQTILPSYKGELYLENHQGTYTSQANVTKMNRVMEEKLKSLEIVLSLTNKFDKEIYQIKKIWEEVLLYQFHDILPGSSIKRVYDECLARYEIISDQVDQIFKKALPSYTTTINEETYLYNPLHYAHEKILKVNNQYLIYNLKPFETSKPSIAYRGKLINNTIFDTKDIIYEIDETGFIKEITYKPLNKKLAKDGLINELLVFKDFGDAWNIKDHYREQTPERMKLVNQIIKDYERFYEITQNYIFKESKLTEVITIDKETSNITFAHNLDWKNTGYMLRTSSEINLDTEDAYFDIQFGEISRKRTNNNKIDTAQFEVPGQKWVSINDNELSFNMINDSKYGYYVKNNTMDINLLRSTNYPAINGDIDKTSYKYQFIIKKENHTKNNINRQAIIFNTFYPAFTEELKTNNFLSFDNDNIEISAIKVAEEKDGYIIRLYNKNKVRTNLTFTRENDIKDLYLTNLIEENIERLIKNELKFGPFEIKTIKIIK